MKGGNYETFKYCKKYGTDKFIFYVKAESDLNWLYRRLEVTAKWRLLGASSH